MNDATPANELLWAAGIDPDSLADLMPRVDPATVKVRVAPSWFRRFWARGIVAVSLPFGIYVQPNVMERFRSGVESDRWGPLVVHELMHIEQWRRLGAFRHVTQYLGDYLSSRRQGFGHWEAYRSIRLEVEARDAATQIRGGGMR